MKSFLEIGAGGLANHAQRTEALAISVALARSADLVIQDAARLIAGGLAEWLQFAR